MKTNHEVIRKRLPALLAAASLAAAGQTQLAHAQVTSWSGAGTDQNWSTAANWTSAGGSTPPATGDTVLFDGVGSAVAAGTIDNILDAGYTAVPGSLILSNDVANTFHTTEIPSGSTLSIGGDMYVGGTNQSAVYTFVGGGTLMVGGGSSTFTMANNEGNAATLDLSTLTNFLFNAGGSAGNFYISLDNGHHSGGVVNLAAVSNNITANNMYIGRNNTGGSAISLNLGAGTNILNVNTLDVAWDKIPSTIQFGSDTGALRLRNAAGTGRATLDVADNGHSGSSSATTIGNVLLNGHYVDMMLSTLTLANRHARSGGSDSAYFSFDTGVVDASSVAMAINTSGGTAPTAVLSVGGGALKVGGSFSLVNCGGTAGSGTLIITNGATVTCSNIFKTTSTGVGTVTVSDSTLKISSPTGNIGDPSAPIDNLNLTNANLHLSLDASAYITSIDASAINTGGTNNITIDSIVNASGSVSFTLIAYTGTDPYSSLVLHLPFGYSGNLVDDTANSQILLNVVAPTSVPLVWVGATNSVLVSNWETNKTKNWIDQATLSVPQTYGNPDPVTFDDTAANGIVTLLTTNTPNSITLNNNTLNYTFNGPGKISGFATLTKQDNASLLLADNGDDFSGGVQIYGGTVIFDNTNGAISGGLTIGGSTVAQIGNNDTNGKLPSGALDDEGTLIFQRTDNVSLNVAVPGGGNLTQNGSGTLLLTANNTYTGYTTASKGTLALSGNGSIAASYGLILSNATFDVTAAATPVFVNDLNILTNGTLTVGATNLQPAITVNSLEASGIVAHSNVINVLAMPAVASYPATFPLIKSAGPIYLANGNFNFILGSLPDATPAYAGTLSESADQTTIELTLTSGPVGNRPYIVWAGIDNVSATTNWSDGKNWLLPGAPTLDDNLIFDSSTTVGDGNTVNNFVDANYTVSSLTFGNTNSMYQVTQIPANTVLTVNDSFTVGNAIADNAVTHAVFTDAGTLIINGAGANLVGNSGSSSSSGNASLDLSHLSNFVYNVSSGTFGIGNLGSRGIGSISLAGNSNSITASTVAIMTSSASSSVAATSTLGGGTNIINANVINIAATRASGTLQFDPGIPTGGLRIRGTSGDDASRSTMVLGNRSSGGTSGTANGTLMLTGHPVDLKLGTLTIGQCNQASPVAGVGDFEYSQGIVDVNGINMAINTGTGSATGTLNVGGGTLIVGSGGINLVNQANGSATANVNFTTANVTCSNSIVKTSSAGVATVTITDSTLNLMGTLGTLPAPIDTLNLADSGTLDTKIGLNVVVGVTNIVATSISAVGTTTININSLSGLVGTTQIPLISYTGSSPMSGLALGTVPAGYSAASLVDTGTTIDLVITPPAPITWVGAVGSVLNSSWDTSTLDWLNGSTPVAYSDVDYVAFNDNASNGVVTLASTVSPASILVNNSALDYTFNGAGSINGFVSITKEGTGTMVLDNVGSNTFSGGINLTAGTVQVGDNDANGNVPASGNITDNGTLAFDRTDSFTTPNLITGTGNLTQMGTGTNMLTAFNSYTGTTLISTGMVIATSAHAGTSSIGSSDGAVYITNGATLDIENGTAQALSFTNTTDTAGKQFYMSGAGIGGAGAIVNNGSANQQNAIQNLTLTGDATVGGSGRWDMRVPDGMFQPILDMQGHTLTKTGSNQMSMVALIVTNGGNIIINSGIFSFETISSNANTHVTVNAGGILGHYRQNATLFTAPITLNGGMIRDLNGTPGSTNDAPITLTADSFLDLNVNSTDLVQLNGIISESGGSYGLTKTNIGTYALSAANTYSGTTYVAQGHLMLVGDGSISQSKLINVAGGATLDASQRNDQTLTLNSGQTLSGSGLISGIVNTLSGSTVAPGSPTAIGTLTFNNNVTLAGTNTFKVSHTTSAASDALSVSGTLAIGGTLNIELLDGSTFAGGDTFTLFSASGGVSGTFTVTNLPALGGGLAWDTSHLENGVLSIIATVNTTPTNITASVVGNTLSLNWPADHTGWRLQVQTNAIGAGLNANTNSWYTVPGSDSVNSENITVDPSVGTVFYRLVYP